MKQRGITQIKLLEMLKEAFPEEADSMYIEHLNEYLSGRGQGIYSSKVEKVLNLPEGFLKGN
jgi:hypothetical protein